MLSRKARLIGVVFIAALLTPSVRANADGADSPITVLRQAVAISISARQGTAPVRVRLVEKLPTPESAASVSLPSGASDGFVVEVKQSALSVYVLAAAFHARSAMAGRRAKYPSGDIVVNISEMLSNRTPSPRDQAAFAPLIAELRGHTVGDVIEVSGQ